MPTLIKSDKKRIYLTGIQPEAWEHPADRTALKALRAIPALDTLLKTILSPTLEKSIRLATLASAVRVSPKQFGKVHELHLEACKVLDLKQIPELYISQNPVVNAYAVGWSEPFVILNSSILQTLGTEDEVLGILGHELGHIRSGHVLYKTLLHILVMLSQYAFQIPLTGLALEALILALREWDRKSELSADRAEALVTQNPDTVIRALMKITGGNMVEEMDLGEFIKQAEEYTNRQNALDSVHKVLNTLYLTHPFPVIRVMELINWVRSGDYDNILNGSYKNQTKSHFDNVKDTAKSYQKEFENTVKPMEDIMEQMRDNAEDIARKAKEMFDNLNKKK
jgi:Zn-dependent protease with chaperone function